MTFQLTSMCIVYVHAIRNTCINRNDKLHLICFYSGNVWLMTKTSIFVFLKNNNNSLFFKRNKKNIHRNLIANIKQFAYATKIKTSTQCRIDWCKRISIDKYCQIICIFFVVRSFLSFFLFHSVWSNWRNSIDAYSNGVSIVYHCILVIRNRTFVEWRC